MSYTNINEKLLNLLTKIQLISYTIKTKLLSLNLKNEKQ